jgi:putative tryptophan/tyrosine transport system substrate-binding protein
MNRRAFVTGLGAVLAAPLGAGAQQDGKAPRIGYLSEFSPPPPSVHPLFFEALREFGWVDGHNVIFESRWANGHLEQLPELAAELVRLRVNIIVTGFSRGTIAAKNATSTIPIVMMSGVDPVYEGLIASLARPGGNVTGTTVEIAPETAGWSKRLQLLKEAAPTIAHVTVLWTRFVIEKMATAWLTHARSTARTLGVTLQVTEISAPEDLDAAFATIKDNRTDSLAVFTDPTHNPRIIDFAARNRLPAVYGFRAAVEAGGLLVFGPDLVFFRRAAEYVDKILRGAKPAELPVQQPTKFVLVINLKTAKALGLTIPPSLLLRADQVIE